MAPSKSRNVNGYVSTVARLRAAVARLEALNAKHEERTRPLRVRVAALKAGMEIRYAKLKGAQITEARRLTDLGRYWS
jgi:hypothetical protein